MAEIRCPMCGKPNPEDLEICQFCQARLRPLIAPSPDDRPRVTEEESAQPEPEQEPIVSQPSVPEESAPPVGDARDVAAWLEELEETESGSGVESPREEQPSEISASSDEEIPEWLATIRARAMADQLITPEEKEEEEEAASEDEATWLSRLREKRQAGLEEQVDTGPLVEESEEDYLDRLRALHAVETGEGVEALLEEGEAATEEEPPEPSEVESHPVESSEELRQPEAEAEAEAESKTAAGVSWLAGIELGGAEDLDLEREQTEAEAVEPQATETGDQSLPQEAEWPEWMREESLPPSAPQDESLSLPEEPKAIIEEPTTPEVPMEKEEEPEGTDEEAVEFDLETLPDWIEEALEEEVVSEGELPAEEALELEGELAPAELPSWLRAMRPVEAAEEETVEQEEKEVTFGPLAGLRGVLPAEAEIAQPRKAPPYPMRLQVTEQQTIQADVFRRILETEGAPKSLPAPRLISPNRIFRWVTAILLLSAVLWSVIRGQQQVMLPTADQVGVIAVHELISSLPVDAKVLVGFDYQPGLSAELEATAQAVIVRALRRGARLTLVSTSPTGPALAERFLRMAQLGETYLSGQQYINLGYIAGGALGLRGFANYPQRAKSVDVAGYAVWDTPPLPLLGIRALADYHLVIVITDDFHTAQAWIEQVQPVLGETPMIFITSAQVGPLIRPYVEGSPQQVRGLIAGLAGAAYYERVSGQEGLARQYWDSLSVGTFVVVLLIFVGCLGVFAQRMFRSSLRMGGSRR